MSYTNVFGGGTIYPSDVSYLALALTANAALSWPLEADANVTPAARVIDVTPSANGFSVTLPDATQTGPGQTILFNNVSGSYSFTVKDNSGGTIATVAAGEQWQVYLYDTSTVAGGWRVFRFGASTATVQPSSLAGLGLTTTGSTLSQSTPVTTFNTTGATVSSSNRAGLFVWTGSGSGTLNLASAPTLGSNFFCMIRNSGGGALTVDPAGGELINGQSTLVLRPGDSVMAVTDGSVWYTVGFGQDAVFAFDYTSITVTGGSYTLTGGELNRIAYKFVGTLTSNQTIIVPSTVQQYWVNNSTTGAYTLSLKTPSGTPIQINQGARGIYYCDGSDVILADTASISLPITIAQGGTSATTASAARLNLGITSFADSIVTATTDAAVRTIIGAAASGANNDITSLSGLTTPLSVPQGGTGVATFSAGYLLKGNGASAVSVSVVYDTGTNVGIGTATPSEKLEVVGGNIKLDASSRQIGYWTGPGLNDGYIVPYNASGQMELVNSFTTGGILFKMGNAKAEYMRLTPGGFLGIATSTPQRPLHVLYDSAVQGQYTMVLQGRTGGYGAGVSFQSNLIGGSLAEMARITADGENSWSTDPALQDAGLRFYTSLDGTVAEKARLSSGGSFGVGTPNPTTYATRLSAVGADTDVVSYVGTSTQGLYTSVDNTSRMVLLSSSGGGAGGFIFRTGNTERVRLTSAGNFGIGTSAPAVSLDVNGSIYAGYTASGQTIAVFNGDVTNRQRLVFSMSGTDAVVNATRSAGTVPNMLFQVDASEKMRISNAGDVGIGTSSPTEALEISRTTDPKIRFVDVGNIDAKIGITGSTALAFEVNGSERFRVGSSGQIGLGGANYGTTGQAILSNGSGSAAAWSSVVTSVSGTGTVNGLTLTGTVTSTGSLTLGGTLSGVSLTTAVTGTLPIANGGTNVSTAPTNGQLLVGNGTGYTLATITAGTGISVANGAGTITIAATGGTGTVTSVNVSGGTTGLSFSGGPVTTSGTITLAGTLAIANGGTGATTAGAALTALGAYAATNPAGYTTNTGTVTSVSGTGSANGLTLSGTVTTSGNITLGGSVTSVASGATIDGVTIGYRSIPRSTTSGTAVVGDVGKVIAVSAGLTIPNATFAAGDAISIYNDSAAAVTITQGTSLTLRQAGTANTGNRTLAARGMATVWFNSATEAVISGAGVT